MIASVPTKAMTCTTELRETRKQSEPKYGVRVTHQPRVGNVEKDASQQIPQQPDPILQITPLSFLNGLSEGVEEAGDDGTNEGEEVDELDAVGIAQREEEEEKRESGSHLVLVDVKLELALHGGLMAERRKEVRSAAACRR